MTTNDNEFINIQESTVFQDIVKNMTLGSVMRSWRKCDDLTLQAVAKRLGISKQLLGDYERGTKLPSLSKTIEMATVLEAPVELWIRYRIEAELNTLGYEAQSIEVRKAG
jgi:transcriptional regulator with XRE-family HTH domain